MKRKKSKTDRPHKKIRAVIGRPSERGMKTRLLYGDKIEVYTTISISARGRQTNQR